MSIKLRELIRAVRACKTAAEERAVIQKEAANIRGAFKDNANQFRHRNVAKLLFMHMLNYPTHWGQVECLKLIASPRFTEKRVGYLGLMLLLDETQDVIMLATNSMKMDMGNPQQFIAGLALSAFGNICSSDIARDLSGEIEKLIRNPNPYLRKKAVLCATRIVRKCPDLIENFEERLPPLLNDKNHGVLVSALQLLIDVCELSPESIKQYRKLVPSIVRILKNLVLSGYTPEHDVSGLIDPFMQVKAIRLLRYLGHRNEEASEQMNDILAQVATNTEGSKNAGNAILYECVRTIMQIESESGLRVLAINILGRFLLNRDNNIRFVALDTFNQVVHRDVQAVQRHRSTIQDCLRETDASIRKRALDLLCNLVNENNVKVIVRELLGHLTAAEGEWKADLTAAICNVVELYSPTARWYVDMMMRVLTLSGNHVQDETAKSLIMMVQGYTDLHAYIASVMYQALQADMTQVVLVQVAVWCVGEFGDSLLTANAAVEGGDEIIQVTDSQLVDLVETVLESPLSDMDTKQKCLTAMLKLSARLPAGNGTRIASIIASYSTSMNLEMQQRAVEFGAIFKFDDLKAKVLEHMPAPTEEQITKFRERRAGKSFKMDDEDEDEDEDEDDEEEAAKPSMASSFGAPSAGGMPKANAPAQQAAAPSLIDMDLFDDPVPVAAQPSQHQAAPQASQPAPSSGGDDLLDLLGDMGAPSAPPPQQQMQQQPAAAAAPAAGGVSVSAPFQVYAKSGVTIFFEVATQAASPGMFNVKVHFSNATPVQLEDWKFQVATAKHVKLEMGQATNTFLPPQSEKAVTQPMKMVNLEFSSGKKLQVKMRLEFKANGQACVDEVDLSPSLQHL